MATLSANGFHDHQMATSDDKKLHLHLEQRRSSGDQMNSSDRHENLVSQQAVRNINSLPLHSIDYYSPYYTLEFPSSVQDYCQNRNNHLILNKSTANANGNKMIFAPSFKSQQKTQSYNSINAPFNKIVRSCKVVVCGDVAVGKTSLVNRFGRGTFSSRYQTTIGVDFDLQKFSILGQPYVLQLWDTAGLERFRCITSSYYRGCQVALLVFDMSNMSTLASVLKWKEEIEQSAKTFDQLVNNQNNAKDAHSDINFTQNQSERNSTGPLFFLVGTKCDLSRSELSREFIREQANKIARTLQAELWFVSAETGENVNELFHRVAALSFNRCIADEIRKIRFEASTLGSNLKEKIKQQQQELWNHSIKLVKITRKKEGDNKRTRCVNVQCVL